MPTFGSLEALFLIRKQPEPAVAILNLPPKNIHFTYCRALLLRYTKSAAFFSCSFRKSQKKKRGEREGWREGGRERERWGMKRTFCSIKICLDL